MASCEVWECAGQKIELRRDYIGNAEYAFKVTTCIPESRKLIDRSVEQKVTKLSNDLRKIGVSEQSMLRVVSKCLSSSRMFRLVTY